MATNLDTYLSQLDSLKTCGRQLRDRLANDPSAEAVLETARSGTLEATRLWQQDCAALVNQLSGGSKAHWLAREYSNAFLVRSPAGGRVEEATVTEIVERILDVLDQADASLARMGNADLASRQSSVDSLRSEEAPRARRFEFVHHAKLRPILEQAYLDSRGALEREGFAEAFCISCGILEAIITDALEYADHGSIADSSFEARIAAAQRAGLIRGGCARLPPLALKYRELTDASGTLSPGVVISEHEARLVAQVLRVVMRDLDPGR